MEKMTSISSIHLVCCCSFLSLPKLLSSSTLSLVSLFSFHITSVSALMMVLPQLISSFYLIVIVFLLLLLFSYSSSPALLLPHPPLFLVIVPLLLLFLISLLITSLPPVHSLCSKAPLHPVLGLYSQSNEVLRKHYESLRIKCYFKMHELEKENTL